MPDFGLSEFGAAAADVGAGLGEAGAGAAETAAATGAEAAGTAAGLGSEIGLTTAPLAGDIAAGASPGLWGTITGAVDALSPYANTLGKAMSIGNVLKSAIGSPGQAQTASTASPAPYTTPAGPSPEDKQAQQEAYWKQFFSGTGQGLPGGDLPPDILEMIKRQSQLKGA